jgi:antitoxin component YwqK of YwqJK toxin-antitoxin module
VENKNRQLLEDVQVDSKQEKQPDRQSTPSQGANEDEASVESNHITFDEDGETPLESFTIKDGQLNGEVVAYQAGVISGKVTFAGGVPDGTAKFFRPDGRTKQQLNYKGGVRNGESQAFDTKGNLVLIQNFKDGKKDGITQIFEAGRKTAEMTYKDGLRQGPSIYFFASGLPSVRFMYVADMRQGRAETYDNQGRLCRIDTYKDDLIEGLVQEITKEGRVFKTHNYITGLQDGESILYDANGDREEVTVYDKGRVVEVRTSRFASSASRNTGG